MHSDPRILERARRRKRAIGIAVLLAVAGAVTFNVSSRLVQSTLCCGDDAIFAVVAKNLADGRGYLSTFSPWQRRADEARLFDPYGTTTGPTLILPVAAAIRVFGNQYWVPGAVTAIAIASLLAGIGAAWHRQLGHRGWWLLALLLAFLQLVTIDHYTFWFALLGELPAALLLVLGVSLIPIECGRVRAWFGAGIVLGLAILTKTVAAVGVSGVLAALATRAAWGGARRGEPRIRVWKGRACATLLLLAGVLLPHLAFEAWKLAALGAGGYAELKSLERTYVSSHAGSGIGFLAENGFAGVARTLESNWAGLSKFLGGSASASALLGACVLCALLFVRRRRADEHLIMLLGMAAGAHIGWWLALSSSGWTRHLSPGLVYLAAAGAVALARLPLPAGRAALALCLLVALAPRANRVGEVIAKPPYYEPSLRTRSMLATAQFLEALDEPRPWVALSWVSAQDLEYLLPGSRSFVASHWVAPDHRRGRILIGNRRWDTKTRALAVQWTELLATWHAEPIFTDDLYSVYRTGPPQPPAGIEAASGGTGDGGVDPR